MQENENMEKLEDFLKELYSQAFELAEPHFSNNTNEAVKNYYGEDNNRWQAFARSIRSAGASSIVQ